MLKFFLTFILIASITSALLAQTAKPETTHYTCVMHPEVIQDHPGKCPKCGMELVPMEKERKHPTSNIEHRTSKAEGAHHTANHYQPRRDGDQSSLPKEHHHHTQEGHEMKMQSSVNLA